MREPVENLGQIPVEHEDVSLVIRGIGHLFVDHQRELLVLLIAADQAVQMAVLVHTVDVWVQVEPPRDLAQQQVDDAQRSLSGDHQVLLSYKLHGLDLGVHGELTGHRDIAVVGRARHADLLEVVEVDDLQLVVKPVEDQTAVAGPR